MTINKEEAHKLRLMLLRVMPQWRVAKADNKALVEMGRNYGLLSVSGEVAINKTPEIQSPARTTTKSRAIKAWAARREIDRVARASARVERKARRLAIARLRAAVKSQAIKAWASDREIRPELVGVIKSRAIKAWAALGEAEQCLPSRGAFASLLSVYSKEALRASASLLRSKA